MLPPAKVDGDRLKICPPLDPVVSMKYAEMNLLVL